MIIIGILLGIVSLAFLCWLLFTLAVSALPFFAAMSAGMFVHDSGTGPIGAIVAGGLAGILALIAGQLIFASARSPLIRLGVALLFAAPAGFAGYHATHGITALAMPSAIWQQIFASIGSIVVGATAWARMAMLSPDPPVRGNAGRPAHRQVRGCDPTRAPGAHLLSDGGKDRVLPGVRP